MAGHASNYFKVRSGPLKGTTVYLSKAQQHKMFGTTGHPGLPGTYHDKIEYLLGNLQHNSSGVKKMIMGELDKELPSASLKKPFTVPEPKLTGTSAPTNVTVNKSPAPNAPAVSFALGFNSASFTNTDKGLVFETAGTYNTFIKAFAQKFGATMDKQKDGKKTRITLSWPDGKTRPSIAEVEGWLKSH